MLGAILQLVEGEMTCQKKLKVLLVASVLFVSTTYSIFASDNCNNVHFDIDKKIFVDDLKFRGSFLDLFQTLDFINYQVNFLSVQFKQICDVVSISEYKNIKRVKISHKRSDIPVNVDFDSNDNIFLSIFPAKDVIISNSIVKAIEQKKREIWAKREAERQQEMIIFPEDAWDPFHPRFQN